MGGQRLVEKGQREPAPGSGRAVPTPRVLPVVPPGLASVAGKAPWELDLEEGRGEGQWAERNCRSPGEGERKKIRHHLL